MTSPFISFLTAPQTGSMLPAAIPTELSQDEQGLIAGLAGKLSMQGLLMRLQQAYYDGEQRMADLGISIPPTLSFLRTVVDWPRIAIDPLVSRQRIDGFRLPGAVDVDDDLMGIWQANNMDAEAPLSFLDALMLGRGYMIGGSPDVSSPVKRALITVESPFNLAMNWDPRTRQGTAAYQSYENQGIFVAVLYTPDYDIHMSREGTGQWQIDDRDEHHLGELSVKRLPNRARSSDREGRSQITSAIMNTTDSACRTLLGVEIAREFHSVPQKWAVGVSERDFQDADGNTITAWEASMNKFIALERDDTGAAPQLGQFQSGDPSNYTKIIDEYGQLMASYTGFPPDMFGVVSTSNPASADAIRSGQDGLNREALRCNTQFSDPIESMLRLAWRIEHNGADVPDEFHRMETDWASVATPTPSADADAAAKLVSAGIVPARSRVLLQKLGFSAVQRAIMDEEFANSDSSQLITQVSDALSLKAAKLKNQAIIESTPPKAPTPAATAGPTPPAVASP